VKKRTWLAKGYGSFQSAWRTLEGVETVNMIRKGRVRWVAKDDVNAQPRFVGSCSVSMQVTERGFGMDVEVDVAGPLFTIADMLATG
jgi:hypothetical protein